MERQGRLDPGDLGLVQRPPKSVDGRRPVVRVDHDLRDQVVVLGGNAVAGFDRRVDPHARPAGHDPAGHAARRGREVATGVLRGDPDLDGVARRVGGLARRTEGGVGKRSARREEELLADDVQARHELGHTVLDLEARVDLQEVEPAVGRPKELGGRSVPKTGGRGDPDRELVEARPLVAGQAGRGRLLDELLVAPLEGAVALADRDHATFCIAQQLDLDVARRGDLPLEVDGAVAERRGRLLRARGQRGRELCRGLDSPHPPPAPARGRLDEQGEADRLGLGDDLGQLVRPVHRRRLQRPRDRVDPDGSGGSARMELVAEGVDDRRGRADEHQAGGLDRGGKRRSLGEEAVARMDRLCPGCDGCIDDGVDPEVALCRCGWPHPDGGVGEADVGRVGVGIAEDRDGLDAELPAGPNDPDRDLATVRDEQPLERRHAHVFAQRRAIRDGRGPGFRAGCCHASSAGWCPAWSPASRMPG